MARFIVIGGTAQVANVRFPDGFTTASAAEQGNVSIGTIEIDDPAGVLDLKNLNPAYIVESAASPTRLWTGFLYNLTIARSTSSDRTAASRVWVAECVDINWMLTERVILSANGTRQAETDLVRLAWLLANPAMAGLVYSGSLTNLSTGATNLDAADYRYQTPMEILADMAPQSGKVAFAFYNPSTAKVELFYDLQTASTNDSTAKISNILSDAGAGVYPPFTDASMERVGENIASKAVLRWVGGVTVGENLTTKSTYGEMTYTWDSSRIGRAATAAGQVATVLAARAGPEETVTCRLLLPAANVNDILEGQRIQCKFSHLPGLTSYTWMRVIRRAVAVDESDQYLVQLTLSNKVRPALGGGPGTGTLPHPSDSPGTLVQRKGDNNGTVTMDAVPVDGDLLMAWCTGRTATPTLAGWTLIKSVTNINQGGPGNHWGTLFTKTASGETGIYNSPVGTATIHVSEWSGVTFGAFVFQSDVGASATMNSGGAITPSANNAIVVGCGVVNFFWVANVTPDSGVTELFDSTTFPNSTPTNWVGYKTLGTAASTTVGGTITAAAAYTFGGVTYTLLPVADANPPQPGQPVGPETVVMTGASGTTANPFADGSLRVFVDNTEQTTKITSYDGATGAFTLAFTPTSTELVQVYYQGR
jgi:hypothetical protein